MESDYKEWRSFLSNHFKGRWDAVLPQLIDSELAANFMKGNTSVTCPFCGEKKFFCAKLALEDARGKCARNKCGRATYDGIATAFKLGNYARESDVCKALDELYGYELHNIRDYPGLKKGKKKTGKPLSKRPSLVRPKPIKKPIKVKLNEKAKKTFDYINNSIVPLTDDSAGFARNYFMHRGLEPFDLMDVFDGVVFYHPSLYFYEAITDENDKVIDTVKGKFPAVVCKVYSFNGDLLGFHRIYINPETGLCLKKAKSETGNIVEVNAKRRTSALYDGDYSLRGTVVPLGKATKTLRIAEGVETAAAVTLMYGNCWSVLDANGIKNFVPPEYCEMLEVYGDLDKSGTGQNAITELYVRLMQERPDIRVVLKLPPESLWNKDANPKGIDFLDVLLMKELEVIDEV